LQSYENYNIILINLDGLREDKVDSCVALQSMKKDSIYFSNMITVSPYTLASHHSIISGLYPSQHGIDAYHHMFKFKKDEITTLPELLKQANYFTQCDCQLETLMTKKGFDKYDTFDEHSVNYKKRYQEILKEISKQEKFFLFLQYSQFHTSLVKDVVKDSNDDEYYENVKENEKRFEKNIPDCSNVIDTITSTLNELKILDKTILIILSDHGTSFGEKKGEKFYGTFVYDNTIKCFCLLHIPNLQPKHIVHQCSNIDIFPTIAEIAGLLSNVTSKDIMGNSLFDMIKQEENVDREVFVETGGLYGPWPSPKKHNVFCIRKNNKKLIYNSTPNTWEFYDLKSDPQELKNLYDESSELILSYKERLLFYFQKNQIDIYF